MANQETKYISKAFMKGLIIFLIIIVCLIFIDPLIDLAGLEEKQRSRALEIIKIMETYHDKNKQYPEYGELIKILDNKGVNTRVFFLIFSREIDIRISDKRDWFHLTYSIDYFSLCAYYSNIKELICE